MEMELKKLKDLLFSIQLAHYEQDISEKLRITRIDHFDHVVEADLTAINMTMPEIRRLFDALKKMKRKRIFSKIRKSFRLNDLLFIQESDARDSKKNADYIKQESKSIIDEGDLNFKEVLGAGAFGRVKSAEWMRNSQKQLVSVAVKCLKDGGNPQLPDVKNKFIEEANAMTKLNHPNLIRLYGVVLSAPVMLVFELAPLGSLLTRLRKEPEKFLLSTLCSFIVQIAAGMKYLEVNKFVHGDLAARNILLMSYVKVKIGDFGLAKTLKDDMDYYEMKSDELVPYAWCAPECLKFRHFSHASDVWAFGIVVYELFSYGLEPWAGLNGAEILDMIDEPGCERPSCPDNCPSAIYNTIYQFCWSHSPENRDTFAAIEKRVLEALPQELRAQCELLDEVDDQLTFQKGDLITILEIGENFCKGQNRTTTQVGLFPTDLLDNASGTIKGRSSSFSHKVSPNVIQKRSASLCDYLSTSEGLMGRSSRSQSYESCYSPDNRSFRSFCDECPSQTSYDSGCSCRCSTYSTDSSKRNSDTSIYSGCRISESQPIGIPGGQSSMRNHCKSNQAIYEKYPYDSHCSSSSKSNGSVNIYDNIGQTASPSERSLSVGTYEDRQRLTPDVVNPTKLTKIHRRRSLPRLKTKHAMSYENKMFNSELSTTLSTHKSCSASNVAEILQSSSELKLYDVVPKTIKKTEKGDALVEENTLSIASNQLQNCQIYEPSSENDVNCKKPVVPPRTKRSKSKLLRDGEASKRFTPLKTCVIVQDGL